MANISRASTAWPATRSIVGRCALVAAAALVSAAGCHSAETTPPDAVGAVAGRGTTPMAGSGGRMGTSGSGAVNAGGRAGATGGGAGSVGAGTGGTLAGSGAIGSGGIGSGGIATASGNGGMSTGVGGSGGSPGSGGVAGSGGGGGVAGGGAGGGSGGMGSAGKPCVDVQPPPDPDWPGATCESWSNETSECTADWFAPYCDVSCGRCMPAGGAGAPGVDCSTQGLPNVTGGNGYATRYWDCCQTHCGQSDGHRCSQDGTSRTGDTNSACSGGGSYACYDEAPHAVSDCLSYGYIAKANPNCGGCYRIQFTGEGQYSATDLGSKAIKGKQMIVKVSNTGGDVASNQFDLMVPGGGVGQFNACSKEWGTSDLGAQYGGFLTNCTGDHAAKKECVRQACMKIPAGAARDGCIWFVDWFEVADNPKFTSQATDCPF
jgi:hypothetical protein